MKEIAIDAVERQKWGWAPQRRLRKLSWGGKI